ncbi:MAG: hypothetical protein GY698_21115, partial [Actinomycetia bacterium]|nr:hypothetical protein [Actinomycetes bacterium]
MFAVPYSNRFGRPVLALVLLAAGGILLTSGMAVAQSDPDDALVIGRGGAEHHGDPGGLDLLEPLVGIAGTPSGDGYWLVASDGGVFAYGDARFLGSTGSIRLNKPIVGMASTPS